MNKQKLIEALREGEVSITFKKVSSTTRVMTATLNEMRLPPRETESTNKAKNDDVLNVWSVDDSGWRSFRWDNLIDWTVDV